MPPIDVVESAGALIEAGVQDGSVLAWVLVAGSVITSLLTLYAVIRVWTKAFWRPRSDAPEGQLAVAHPEALLDDADVIEFADREDPGRMPMSMVAPTAGLLAVGLILAIFAGPMFDVTDRAATPVERSNVSPHDRAAV